MFTQRKISLSCLFVYAGFIIGFGLMTLDAFLPHGELGRWGLASLGVACTYSIHRSIAANEESLWHAYELGRQYERREFTAVR